jgi:hypothetical protein
MSSTNLLSPRHDPWVHLPQLPPPPSHTPPPVSPKKRRKSARRIVFAVVGFALLVLGVYAGVGIVNVVQGGLDLKTAGENAREALDEGDIENGATALSDVIASLRQLKYGVSYFTFLEIVPFIGDQIKGGETTIDAALETAEAVEGGLHIFLDSLSAMQGAGGVVGGADGSGESRSYSSLTSEEKELLLQSLAASLPDLRKMQIKLRLAAHDLDRLDDLNLAPAVKNAVAPLREKLPELITAVDIIVPFASIAPEFAGLGHEKQFLLLFLNNDEIRPGGGFMGVYGLLVIKNGDIQSLVTDDTYNVDLLVEKKDDYFVTPPYALREYLIPEWYFRDSAWSPDFTQTAKDATQLFRQEVGYGGQPIPEISGVIGITPTFIARVLDFVGPITVEGQTFTGENIADELEYQVEQQYAVDGTPPEQRKEIVSKVTDEMVHRLMAISPSRWTDFFEIMHAGFDEKEIALMSFDARTQASLEDSDWAGVLNPAASDDLAMVVDANLGALKTDPLVKRHITYSIKPYGSGYRATTSIEYHNTAVKSDWRTTRYRTYTRVYAPLGSTFVSSSGSLVNDITRNPTRQEDTVDIRDELGMTSFGAFTAIELKETRTLSFTYDLPPAVVAAIKRGDYDLAVFKQMGALDNLLTLDLNFGTTVTGAEPPEDKQYWGDKTYHIDTVLNTDKDFRIRL